MDSGRTQPVLLGGLFIGVLSALPVINAGNCCCCLWIVAGGVLAVYLRQQSYHGQINAAEGALVGLLAGLLGGIIGAVLSIPIQMMLGPLQQEWISRILESNPDVPAEMRDMMQRTVAGGAVQGALRVGQRGDQRGVRIAWRSAGCGDLQSQGAAAAADSDPP